MPAWLENLRRRSLITRELVLVFCVVCFLAIVAPIAYSIGGFLGLVAATSACGVCLLGSGSALVVGHFARTSRHFLYGVLAGMMLRMGVPLLFCVACILGEGQLFIGGGPYYLVVFYPVALTVETMMSLPLNERSSDPSENLVL